MHVVFGPLSHLRWQHEPHEYLMAVTSAQVSSPDSTFIHTGFHFNLYIRAFWLMCQEGKLK